MPDNRETQCSLVKSIKFQKARKFYLDPKSGTHLSGKDSLVKAGYALSTAKIYSHLLFKDNKNVPTLPSGKPNYTASTPALRLDPQDIKSVTKSMDNWLALMDTWREALEKVDDPLQLGAKTFSVVSSHIERMAKIFGFIKEQSKGDTNINIHIMNLPLPQQYEEMKAVVLVMIKRIKNLEEQMNLDKPSRFRF